MTLAPGVMTPSEVEQGLQLGCMLQKFFPAEAAGGAKMLKALAGPIRPHRPEVHPDRRHQFAAILRDYLSLPVVAAIGGSWMVDKQLVAAGDWNGDHRADQGSVGGGGRRVGEQRDDRAHGIVATIALSPAPRYVRILPILPLQPPLVGRRQGQAQQVAGVQLDVPLGMVPGRSAGSHQLTGEGKRPAEPCDPPTPRTTQHGQRTPPARHDAPARWPSPGSVADENAATAPEEAPVHSGGPASPSPPACPDRRARPGKNPAGGCPPAPESPPHQAPTSSPAGPGWSPGGADPATPAQTNDAAPLRE
jgi:hypothetical protein